MVSGMQYDGEEVLEGCRRTEPEPRSLIWCGQGRPAQEGPVVRVPEGREPGWLEQGLVVGRGLEEVFQTCARLDMRWWVAFRDERKGETCLGSHRGARWDWAGPAWSCGPGCLCCP